ncbi:MAG: hypothetical protein ABSE08_13005 [Syntrophobacteraceae bacterium]|jgi:hypothetical protein
MATLDDLQADLAKYLAMRDKILSSGQEYSKSDFHNRRPDLKVIEDRICGLRMQVARIQGQTTSYPLFTVRK